MIAVKLKLYTVAAFVAVAWHIIFGGI